MQVTISPSTPDATLCTGSFEISSDKQIKLARVIRQIGQIQSKNFKVSESLLVREGYDSNVYCVETQEGEEFWVIKEYEKFARMNQLSADQTEKVISDYCCDTQLLNKRSQECVLDMNLSINGDRYRTRVEFVSHPIPQIIDGIVYTFGNHWIPGSNLQDVLDSTDQHGAIFERSSKELFRMDLGNFSNSFMTPIFKISSWTSSITDRNYHVVNKNVKLHLDFGERELIFIVTDPANKIYDAHKLKVFSQKYELFNIDI
jgi:hypothetical protein